MLRRDILHMKKYCISDEMISLLYLLTIIIMAFILPVFKLDC